MAVFSVPLTETAPPSDGGSGEDDRRVAGALHSLPGIPEVANVFNRARIRFHQITGMLDVNGHGLLDLAVVFSGGVRVLLGKGDGTFQTTHSSYLAGGTPSAVVVADVNGDGRADLAVANRDTNDVSILLNDGQ